MTARTPSSVLAKAEDEATPAVAPLLLETAEIEGVAPGLVRTWDVTVSFEGGTFVKNVHVNDPPGEVLVDHLLLPLGTRTSVRGHHWRREVQGRVVPQGGQPPGDDLDRLALAASGRAVLPDFAGRHVRRLSQAFWDAISPHDKRTCHAQAEAAQVRKYLPSALRRALRHLPADEVRAMLDEALVSAVLEG